MSTVPAAAGPAGHLPCPVVAVGVDLASVPEVRQAIRDFGDSYLRRLFTSEELAGWQSYNDPIPRLATMFAAKEAVLKVLEVDQTQPLWTSIEVRSNQEGGCALILTGTAAELAKKRGIGDLAVSISREGDLATAVVIATSAR